MHKTDTSMKQFESDYSKALKLLSECHLGDDFVDALLFVEEARVNSGSDDYLPEWIQPFVGILANLVENHIKHKSSNTGELTSVIPPAIGPTLVRAIQLGYTEGYFAAKDD